MNKLLLTFYGDDFTGSTDALEQLSNHGIRAMLFIEPPTHAQLKRFPDLQAVGVAGMTRSKSPPEMERDLRPALAALRVLGARHVHYKICSTFDSSPAIGSIGRVIDVATDIFDAPFVPLLVAAPALGRYCIFGTLFARYGIGSEGEIHRLDRHPSISRHPTTPMQEADLRCHLAKQTNQKIELFDILKVALSENESRAALKKLLAGKPRVVLFDALYPEQLPRIGRLIDKYASRKQPLFSVGSSGIEMALGAQWAKKQPERTPVPGVKQLLVGSGSCSPVTTGQIAWGLKNGFSEVVLEASALISDSSQKEIQRAIEATAKLLRSGRSVIVHTAKRSPTQRPATKSKKCPAKILGVALGQILRGALMQTKVRRLCIAGGDTSSFAARALGIESLEIIAPLTTGAPLCRVFAPGSPGDGMEAVFKGGQVGAENYFGVVKRGNV